MPPGTRSEQSFGKVLTASCRQAARTPKAAVRLPDSEQSFGMFTQAARLSPILAFGQRAAASWAAGRANGHPRSRTKYRVFVWTQRIDAAGWRSQPVRTLSSGRKPEQSVGLRLRLPDSADEGGRLPREAGFYAVVLVDCVS